MLSPNNLHSRRSSVPTMTMKPRLRRIIHQLFEQGTARLVVDETFQSIHGVLLNQNEDTFGIHGRVVNPAATHTTDTIENAVETTTGSTEMRVNIVDCETGDRYTIENVRVNFAELVNEITGSIHVTLCIDNAAIKFRTQEVLIGNRADVEIAQYIDPKLSPNGTKKVLIGPMTLRVVANEKTAPSERRISECVSTGAIVLEQSNDFLA
ncbi:hypothetical protein M3Y99_01491700 [Aphelenchoides fujianensis]|nr:hypothetical protein M3Y99_01491700 [Aphelenchoides fujianensis]